MLTAAIVIFFMEEQQATPPQICIMAYEQQVYVIYTDEEACQSGDDC